jgi:hypothetical protein
MPGDHQLDPAFAPMLHAFVTLRLNFLIRRF